MAPLLRFQIVERGLAQAQVAERRTPQAGDHVSTTLLAESDSLLAPIVYRRDTIANPDGGQSDVSVPSLTGTRALAGIIVFLGIVVLGIAGLRFRKWWRSRVPQKRSPHLRSLSLCESPLPEKIVSEKRNPLYTQTLIDFGYGFSGMSSPEKAHLRHDSSSSVEEMTGKWVPQIKPKRPSLKARDSLDLMPRPFSGLLPPAPTAQRNSRFARFASAIAGSPKPSITSFDKVPPYSSRAPSPAIFSKEAITSAATPQASSDPVVLPSKQDASSQSKAQQPSHEQKAATTLPSRTSKPRVTLPRIPVPKASPPTAITIEGVTQQLLAARRDAAGITEPLKSPTRMDSIRKKKRTKSLVSLVLAKSPENPFSSPTDNSSVQSPTTSSESHESSTTIQESNEQKLPRLVIVIHLFKPSMPDELPVRRGEVLRMTDEFKDGWCAVQRLSNTTGKTESGVVPRMCVTDGPTFDPNPSSSLKSRFSNSTTYSHSTSSTTYTKAYEPLRTPSPTPQLPS